MSKTNEALTMVFCVTSFGKIIGVYADANDAFQTQMQWTNKGRVAELVPMQITYPINVQS